MRALRASCSLVESGRGDGPPLERCGKSMGSLTVKAISERIMTGARRSWVGAMADLRALESVPFWAHIGSGCKEAPTCLCQSQYPRVGPSFVPIAEHCIP